MNVIIYCRVSSDEQTLGASLDVQEERLRKYCNPKIRKQSQWQSQLQ